jgi:hypothetical protein
MYFNQDIVLKTGTTAAQPSGGVDVRFSKSISSFNLTTSLSETQITSYVFSYYTDNDIGNNFSNGVFTAPYDGLYLFHFCIFAEVHRGIASYGCILKKNGTTPIAHLNVRNLGYPDLYSQSVDDNMYYNKNATVLYSADANDTFSLYAYFENVEQRGFLLTYSSGSSKFEGTLIRKY